MYLFNSVVFSLQSADMSPASSTTSLPVSPLTEEPLPFKVKNKQKIIIYDTFRILKYFSKILHGIDGKVNCFNT